MVSDWLAVHRISMFACHFLYIQKAFEMLRVNKDLIGAFRSFVHKNEL